MSAHGFITRTSHGTRCRCALHGIPNFLRSLLQRGGMPTASAIVRENLGRESAGSARQGMLQAEPYA